MIETVLLYGFAAAAAAGAVAMLIARHPMRVALALVACMLSLAGIYALLGVHVIAVFQVLIYVGAVMVFMVYVIMLIDVRDSAFVRRFSWLLAPGIAGFAALAAVLCYALWRGEPATGNATDAAYGVQPFSEVFLNEYWLYFELVSVLLVAAVVAAIAVVKLEAENAVTDTHLLVGLGAVLFAAGLIGVMVRRNALVMLMCMELMLNGVNLTLVTFARQTGATEGVVLVFLVFVVAAAEVAIAIPILLLLARARRTLDIEAYAELKG